MQKAIFLLSLLIFCKLSFGQQNIATIKATSPKVDIRVGDDYFMKGGWILEPEKDPDVFYIGSKWLYKTKKVTFITDIDSISFDVQAGHTYDFTILLNNTTACNIQIAVMADPVFMNVSAILLIALGIIAVLVFCYLYRKKIDSKTLVNFGYVAPVLFWLMTIASGAIHGNYNHLRNVISELGAIGTKSELFTSLVLILLSIACILFSIGFYRISKQEQLSILPAILSFATPITMIWAAIFTLGNEFHSATGPLPLLVIIGSLSAFFLWRKNKAFLNARKISLLSCVLMLLILTRFIKPFGIQYEGLVQRFFYLGWSIWTFGIAYYLSKYSKEKQS